MIEYYLILGLVIFNIFQLLFWSWQVHRLTGKIMSRNYAEYVQATRPVTTVSLPQPDESDESLDDLNRTLGL